MSPRLTTLALSGLFALTLGGCGDDGGNSGESGSSGALTTSTTAPSSTTAPTTSTSTDPSGSSSSTTAPPTSTSTTTSSDSSGSSGDSSSSSGGGSLGPMVVYVSSDVGLSVWSVEPTDGTLTDLERVDVGSSVGPTAIDPVGLFLYAAQVGDQEITTFAVEPSGTLSEVETIGVDHRPVYLAVDATSSYVLSASYGENVLRVYPIEADGTLGDPTSELSVQDRPHSIVVDPSNSFVLVPTLGANIVEQYLFDANAGTLTLNDPPEVAAPNGAGPRHLAYSPDGANVYVGNELDSTVSRYRFSATGTLTIAETVSTLPGDFVGDNTVADTHITPDGANLYVSNRGDDSIAIYSVGDDGVLSEVKHVDTEPRPRDFHITPDGGYLYAAGQDSGMLASYTIEDDGSLTPGDRYEVGAGAAWVLAADLLPL